MKGGWEDHQCLCAGLVGSPSLFMCRVGGKTITVYVKGILEGNQCLSEGWRKATSVCVWFKRYPRWMDIRKQILVTYFN